MSATQPLVCSAWYTPPLPSGAVATSLLDFINIAPASEKHGKSPCWKNVTDAASRPKYAFATKYASVSACVNGEVMTYKGTVTGVAAPVAAAASLCSRASRSHCSRKSVRPLGRPMSYMPLGAEDPSRVPCPPASRTTASSPFAAALKPASAHASAISGFDASSSARTGSIAPLDEDPEA